MRSYNSLEKILELIKDYEILRGILVNDLEAIVRAMRERMNELRDKRMGKGINCLIADVKYFEIKRFLEE